MHEKKRSEVCANLAQPFVDIVPTHARYKAGSDAATMGRGLW